jgi:hypothetical protein
VPHKDHDEHEEGTAHIHDATDDHDHPQQAWIRPTDPQ